MNNEKTLVKAIRHAAYVYADKQLKATNDSIDSEKRIEKCLNCPFAECINCYDNRKRLAKEIHNMYKQGQSIMSLCKKVGISRRQLFYLFKEIA